MLQIWTASQLSYLWYKKKREKNHSKNNNIQISVCTHKLRGDVILNTFLLHFFDRMSLFGARRSNQRHSHCSLFLLCSAFHYAFNAFLSANFHIFNISFCGFLVKDITSKFARIDLDSEIIANYKCLLMRSKRGTFFADGFKLFQFPFSSVDKIHFHYVYNMFIHRIMCTNFIHRINFAQKWTLLSCSSNQFVSWNLHMETAWFVR